MSEQKSQQQSEILIFVGENVLVAVGIAQIPIDTRTLVVKWGFSS
jgi:hypothetical protein